MLAKELLVGGQMRSFLVRSFFFLKVLESGYAEFLKESKCSYSPNSVKKFAYFLHD